MATKSNKNNNVVKSKVRMVRYQPNSRPVRQPANPMAAFQIWNQYQKEEAKKEQATK